MFSSIECGLILLVGISETDGTKDIEYLVNKITNMRLFPNDKGNFEISVKDANYEILVVSQFTLYGDTRKGRRPSFTEAAKPEKANDIFNQLITDFEKTGVATKTGKFQSHMVVEIVNDGPVTIIIDSKDKISKP
jgi:D-tyrosyl-tRNA(Tyr) deacylase|tara:strand:+ start:166 stop:570 length:405 start_codon:yes stop_codon:yes gene_type:complete